MPLKATARRRLPRRPTDRRRSLHRPHLYPSVHPSPPLLPLTHLLGMPTGYFPARSHYLPLSDSLKPPRRTRNKSATADYPHGDRYPNFGQDHVFRARRTSLSSFLLAILAQTALKGHRNL